MEGANSPLDVYPLGVMLSLRAAVLADPKGLPLIQLAKIPTEVWQGYDAKVTPVKDHRRCSSKARHVTVAKVADSAKTTDVTEVLAVEGEIVQQWIRAELAQGKKRMLEDSTGAKVSEKRGMKGRAYLVVSGSQLAVEQALEALEVLLQAAQAATYEDRYGGTAPDLPPGLACELPVAEVVVNPPGQDLPPMAMPSPPPPPNPTAACTVAEVVATPLEVDLAPLAMQRPAPPPNPPPVQRPSPPPVPSGFRPPSPVAAVQVETSAGRKGHVSSPTSAGPKVQKQKGGKTGKAVRSRSPTSGPKAQKQKDGKTDKDVDPADHVTSSAKSQASAWTGKVIGAADNVTSSAPSQAPAWQSSPSPAHVAIATLLAEEWSCPACTLLNPRAQSRCNACSHTQQPTKLSSTAASRTMIEKKVVPAPKVMPASKAQKPVKQIELLDPLPHRNAAARPAPRMLIAGLVYGQLSSSSTGHKWGERPVERLNSCAQDAEDEDPALACYLWNRKTNRPQVERPAQRSIPKWGFAT